MLCLCPSVFVSHLRTGEFGLGEDEGSGVDGVSQFLLHQLVGLSCFTDPAEEKASYSKIYEFKKEQVSVQSFAYLLMSVSATMPSCWT